MLCGCSSPTGPVARGSGISIVSLVDTAKMQKLRAALHANWSLTAAATWHEFVDAGANTASVLVVDPPLHSRGDTPIRELTGDARAFLSGSGVPTVIYTVATNAAAVWLFREPDRCVSL